MVRRARHDGLCAAVMNEVSLDAVRGFLACLFPGLIVAMTATCAILRRSDNSTVFRRFHARASAAAPGKTERIVTTAAHIVAVAAAPQERAAAVVPALRRGADNEQWFCCLLAATAASRLGAPMLQAFPAFHVRCSSLTPAGVVWSSLRRAAAGEGAEAHDLQSGEVFGACRSRRRRWGAGSAVRRRGDVFLGACRRGRRRGGLRIPICSITYLQL